MTDIFEHLNFYLSFDTVRAFDHAFERKGEETGFFFATGRAVQVGQKACIQARIRKVKAPIFLSGFVAWRRVRSGGPNLPIGVFVALTDRDREQLDAIVDYLGHDGSGKERRRSPRYPLFASAAYRTSKGTHRSEARNISKGGVFLRSEGPLLQVGSRLPIELYLDGQHAKPVSIEGSVAWLDVRDVNKGMGIVFERGQSELKAVAKTIKRIEKDLKRLGA